MPAGLLAALLGVGVIAGEPTETTAQQEHWLDDRQKAALVARLAAREPFLASEEAHEYPGSMQLFFVHADYRTLKGNPIWGWWNDSNFRWVGRRIAWDGIVSAGLPCQVVGTEAWDTAFALAARKLGLVVDAKAPMRLRGACVAATQKPHPGVVLEVRIDSPTGPLKWRFGMGKPTMAAAVGASVELTLLLGERLNQAEKK